MATYSLLGLLFLIVSCGHQTPHLSLVPNKIKNQSERYIEKSDQFMVTSEGNHSAKIAANILREGGNVADAATALSFAISVEKPTLAGMGGGGFLLYWNKKSKMKRPISYDFREMAPLKATEKMFQDNQGNLIPNLSLDGPLSNGVPGMVKGILDFHKKWGKLPLHKVLKEVIELARNGFKVNHELAEIIEERKEIIKKYPSSKKIFFKNDNTPLAIGDLFVQKDLAKTIEEISLHGVKAFYFGDIAKKISEEEKKFGGLITLEDLHHYTAKIRPVVEGDYHGYKIYSMGPPSSGGIHVIEILNTVERDDFSHFGPQHPKTIHLMASAMELAFADRAKYLGDPDFVDVPINGLTSDAYAKEQRKKINLSIAPAAAKIAPGLPNRYRYESDKTTHFSIMDSEGNTVSSTQSLNGPLGSAFVIEGTGIVMNNHMDDFTTKVGALNYFGAVGGENNSIQPKKRPLSSMSPTIVMKDGVPILAVGTRSGTRILTCVAQTIFNILQFNLPLYDSVMMTRYHHQWYPDELRIDPTGFPSSTIDELKSYGYNINFKDLNCRIQAIQRNANGELIGVSDGRGEGLAIGEKEKNFE